MLVRFEIPVRLFSKKEGKFKVYHPGKHEIDKADLEDKNNPGFAKFFQALVDEEKVLILKKVSLKLDEPNKNEALKG